ncbi:putative phage abortive infection protein [Brevibacillus sp. NPDC058079]|uniref:putative phage abortive infection protein n=1 Tax=Brevibacillus sp. NPDC058079 TaxID=3346330 RepID=UPI0036E5EC2D
MELTLIVIITVVLVSSYFFNYNKKGERVGSLTIIVTLVALYAILNPFLIKLFYGISAPELLGQTGDWLGGSSVPLLTFASFILLIATFSTQKKELELTNESLNKQQTEMELTRLTQEKQRVESAIFHGISLHNEIVNSMEFIEHDEHFDMNEGKKTQYSVTYRGRNVIKELYSVLRSRLSFDLGKITIEYRHLQIKSKYKLWYEKNEHYIGHYYRNLYHLFKMIDNSILDPKEKEKYADIVRAQLSSAELLLLFYNAISFSENNNFIPHIHRYNILKHINKRLLATSSDKKLLKLHFNL